MATVGVKGFTVHTAAASRESLV